MKRREFVLGALASAAGVKAAGVADEAAGMELLGVPAPPLGLTHWLNSKPLEMSGLRGRVVLLRWWTEGCPYCAATAPALRALQRKYGPDGLVVIGIYHPKPSGNWDLNAVAAAVREKQFTFPVAVDGDWTALKRWWLTKDRDFTSVSFLVDKAGIIRYVHPGGEFHERASGALPTHAACNRDLHFIQAEIARLLAV